ncbi:MAG: ABC transporter permease subunit [Planctomycetota bacterium]|nr:MAG: ABC transporter permease subunit [Planctomycetota bacterium]
MLLLGTLLAVAPFAWMLADVLVLGLPRVDWSFLTSAPSQAGRAGGIAPILVSTMAIVLVAWFSVVPMGLGAALALVNWHHTNNRIWRWSSRGVEQSLDLLAATPSVVFGLFGNALFCLYLGMGFSILSGGLTLACMVLPLFVRTAQIGLRAAAEQLRAPAAATGLSRSTFYLRLVVPAASPAILAALALSTGRALAETAALIFTSGFVDRMPTTLFDSGRTLSVHIYDLAMNVPGGDVSARATAVVLVGALLLINGLARLVLRMFVRFIDADPLPA